MTNITEMEKYLIKRGMSQQWLDQRTETQIQYIYEMLKDEESEENKNDEALDDVTW